MFKHIDNINRNMDPSAAIESSEELTPEEQQIVAKDNFFEMLSYRFAVHVT